MKNLIFSNRFVSAFTAVILLTSVFFFPATASAVAAQSNIPRNLQFSTLVSGLNQPLFVTHAGDGSGRLFIVERGGKILLYKNNALVATPFLDISSLVTTAGGEQGLLGLAFHPNYSTNGYFFVVYISTDSKITLARYTVQTGDPDQADSGSANILLQITKTRSNHNGGMIAFGPDGYLYMGTGDSGGGGDPDKVAQNKTSLLGKILRLDVDSGSPYGIPTSNPFYSDSNPLVKKEIWAYGLRNPWRFSFDALTADLFIADVGQNSQEEVNFQAASSAGGENYGWSILEGTLCYNPSTGCVPPTGYMPPVAEYAHTVVTHDDNGCSVTGGYVYRGTAFETLKGVYLYGDFCLGKIWGLRYESGSWANTLIADTGYLITSFGEDELGELYLTDYATGSVIKIQEGPVAVESIKRNDPSPTTSTSVTYTVKFNAPVTGVDHDDFSLVTTGEISGASFSASTGSGDTYTVTVDVTSGTGTLRLDVKNSGTGIQDLAGKDLNGGFTSGEVYTITREITLNSQARYDGWVLESTETSKTGGSRNIRGKVIKVGDDDYNRQYRGFLSFDTSGIPDTAVITKVTLMVKKAGLAGTDLYRSHRGLNVDIINPYFGNKPTLQSSDFQKRANLNLVGNFPKKPVLRWYTAVLDSAAYPYVNTTGLTQFRLRYKLDDNNDFGADYLKFYSGNAPLASRPQLIVEYYVP